MTHESVAVELVVHSRSDLFTSKLVPRPRRHKDATGSHTLCDGPVVHWAPPASESTATISVVSDTGRPSVSLVAFAVLATRIKYAVALHSDELFDDLMEYTSYQWALNQNMD